MYHLLADSRFSWCEDEFIKSDWKLQTGLKKHVTAGTLPCMPRRLRLGHSGTDETTSRTIFFNVAVSAIAVTVSWPRSQNAVGTTEQGIRLCRNRSFVAWRNMFYNLTKHISGLLRRCKKIMSINNISLDILALFWSWWFHGLTQRWSHISETDFAIRGKT